MKKIIVITSLLILVITISGCTSKKEKIEITDKDIKVSTETLNISEKGTEINVLIKNDSVDMVNISKIEATLYDSSSKKILTIYKEIDEQIKNKKTLTVKLTTKKQYSSTAKIKYIIYS